MSSPRRSINTPAMFRSGARSRKTPRTNRTTAGGSGQIGAAACLSAPPPAPAAPAATQPGGDRKSENGMPASVYGSLPASLDPARSSTPAPPSLSYAPAASAIAGAMQATSSKTTGAKPAANISAFTFGPGLDELGISIVGVPSPAAAMLDGPIRPRGCGGHAKRWHFPRVRWCGAEDACDACWLLAGGPTIYRIPSEVQGVSPAPPPQNNGQEAVHPKAFDASPGTPFDPLRNKTYDLNYAKTVPAIR